MIKKFTGILGVTFLLVGVVGALTGGHDHNLVIFGINTTHNMVHILSGTLALVAALISTNTARFFCITFGVVYGLVTLLGFLHVPQAVALLNLNMADNFLHLTITTACLYFGLAAPRPVRVL